MSFFLRQHIDKNDIMYDLCEAHVKIVHSFDFLIIDNVLSSCDGRIISKEVIYVDFHFVKDKCSCAFESNVSMLYYLSTYPKYDCGTGIEIIDSNNSIYRLLCTSDSNSGSVKTILTTKVRLTGEIRSNERNEDYCLSVISNSKTYNYLFHIYNAFLL